MGFDDHSPHCTGVMTGRSRCGASWRSDSNGQFCRRDRVGLGAVVAQPISSPIDSSHKLHVASASACSSHSCKASLSSEHQQIWVWKWWRHCRFRPWSLDRRWTSHDAVSASFAIQGVQKEWHIDQIVPSLFLRNTSRSFGGHDFRAQSTKALVCFQITTKPRSR